MAPKTRWRNLLPYHSLSHDAYENLRKSCLFKNLLSEKVLETREEHWVRKWEKYENKHTFSEILKDRVGSRHASVPKWLGFPHETIAKVKTVLVAHPLIDDSKQGCGKNTVWAFVSCAQCISCAPSRLEGKVENGSVYICACIKGHFWKWTWRCHKAYIKDLLQQGHHTCSFQVKSQRF